ncbi:hypothetical protein [Citrobacter sp. UYEF32]|uniref:hypothetical protein n=1 Tax=Citrobacter sp. UYEF32 TaxID=3156347 RepID=UPI00339746F5
MEYRKINLTLIITVLALIFLIACVLLKILFFGDEKIEWGSITDWISSLSTFLTFVVAWKAYKAAPQWIKSKQNEEGFNHVKKLMSEYDEIVFGIEQLHFDILTVKRNDKRYDFIANKITHEILRAYDLNAKLESCSRWNIKYPSDVKRAYLRLTEYYRTSMTVITLSNIMTPDQPDVLLENLENIKNNLANDIEYFNANIEDIFIFPK